MDLHPRCNDIGRIAEERQPHILNMKVIEGFVQRPVEFVALEPNSQHGNTTL
jgi:hypothetical protein